MGRTKIVATIGPASRTERTLRSFVQAGCDAFRLNFSHWDHAEHGRTIRTIRRVAKRMRRHTPIIQDLCGPKLRVGEMPGPVMFERGSTVMLTPVERTKSGKHIPFPHPEILRRLNRGDRIYLSDGAVELRVKGTSGEGVHAEVVVGNVLTSHKGVNVPDMRLNISALTEKDLSDLRFGMEAGVDWVALSFVSRARDVQQARDIARGGGADLRFIAKIERHEALDHIEEILRSSDAVMVARGDLGVEIPIERIPMVQKDLIRRANLLGRPVITATQMLKTMTVSPVPTRAEVTDVANAVLDGTDAVMLSEETAVGRYPVRTVRTMRRIIENAERAYGFQRDLPATDAGQAIASAACLLARDIPAEAIITFTRSGATAIQVARYRPRCPILVASGDARTLRRMGLVWGVVPVWGSAGRARGIDARLRVFVRNCISQGLIRGGALLVATHGSPSGMPGTTNTIKVLQAGEGDG